MIPNFWLSLRGAMMLLALFLALPAQAAFTVNSDGTVTDSATGLVWDQCSWGRSGATCATGTSSVHTWQQALGVALSANNASYKNHTDWRLPNINELESLVDLFHVNPAINPTAFPNTEGLNGPYWRGYWSSTTNLVDGGGAWDVTFDQGSTFVLQLVEGCFVRLVRGGPSFGSFDSQAPNSPFNVVAVLGNARARVGFSAPGGGGPVVSGYTVRAYAVMNGPLGTQSNTTGAMPTGGSGLMQSQSVAGTDINAGSLSLNHTITGLDNGTAYTFTVTANGSEGDSQESAPSDQITPSPFAAPLVHPINLSTRAPVQTGDNVLIGGFIIDGSTPKKVLLRAVGPTLANYGVSGVLGDPTLQLFSGQTVIESNDNWQTASNAADVQATGLAPVNGLESAILTTLNPGAYTAIVSGVAGGTGVGMVEVYEIDNPDTPFINISTRAKVLTADSVMIGGFIIQGNSAQTVLIRAVGPNLANSGVTGVLANPKLDLYSGQTVIDSNDDWQSASNAAAIQATGLAPVSPLESAILITLQPGAYTAIVSGADGGTGVGIVEVFAQ